MMRHKLTIAFAVLLFLNVSSSVQARPVSYPGGWTVMSMNDGAKNSLHFHYSPTAKYSVGYKFSYWRDDQIQTNALQINNLLKRWNNIDSQANFYLKSGIGTAHDMSGDRDDHHEWHGFTGIALDWEDRRYFVSYENSYHDLGSFDDFFSQSARVGMAPYIGEYGDLHTWLMLQVDHEPEEPDHFTVTPLVRFFKGVHLLEVGVSENKEVMVNYIYRF